MIELIGKLPSGMIGVLLAGTAWFGFNYVVLAERAMMQEHAQPAAAACEASIAQEVQSRIVPRMQLGSLLGIPELDVLGEQLVESSLPPAISSATIAARCACAASTSSASLRFDFAVHTSTFRILPVTSIAQARQDVIELATLGTCKDAAP